MLNWITLFNLMKSIAYLVFGTMPDAQVNIIFLVQLTMFNMLTLILVKNERGNMIENGMLIADH